MAMFEDRQHDWLSNEMRREGYLQNSSGLEKQHQQEERSDNWNAGAYKIKQEHEEEHRELEARKKYAHDVVDNIVGDYKYDFIIGLTALLLGFFFWVILALLN